MNVTLHQATDADLPVVRNLVAYYIYDMSRHMGWPCGADGNFGGCDELETYWIERGRHAFVLRDGDELAGFALVRGDHEQDDVDYSIGEFFVLGKFRGQGVGGQAARKLFDRFHGRWMVAQLADNTPALAFWRKVICRYTKDKYAHSDSQSPWGPMNEIRFTSTRQPTTRRLS